MKFKDYPFLNFPDAIANVEVEKDETVMLPNGTVYNIKGKKHKDGGEKVFLPDGTKVFSEHLKLPEDIATKLVGRKTKKSSPAQLSKKFNTLKYKEMMEDNTGKWDRLAVQTAEMMFNKNIAHQNAIFETQEDSKNKKQTDIFKYGGVYKSKTKYQNGGQYPYKLNPSVNEEDNLVTFNVYDPTATSYLWRGPSVYFLQNDPTDSVFTATFEGVYEVDITNNCGTLTQLIELTTEDCTCSPFVPTAFTPNNDGDNDELFIFTGCVLEDVELSVFDRWGARVFSTTDINVGWDGLIDGSIAPMGVYIYKLEYKSENFKGEVVSSISYGDITLVR